MKIDDITNLQTKLKQTFSNILKLHIMLYVYLLEQDLHLQVLL